MPIVSPTAQSLQAELQRFDLDRLAAAGIARDPGSYNLLVHVVPPEVAKDHAATAEVYARLSQPPGSLGLYLHIAPCTGRCTFCHYAIEVNPAEDQLERYLAALRKEMTLRWTALQATDSEGKLLSPVRSVLIGGGTPTYLNAKQLDTLLTHLHRTVDVSQNLEFTCESSPETLTADKLAVLREHGVTRLSVGIQSFDDAMLRLLGRRHDRQGAIDALELVQNAGFPHVNLDLIYALPGQTVEGWLQDVALAADIGVDSMSAYHLRKRPDTIISRKASPAQAVNTQMHLGAMRLLAQRGYRQSLVDYFCKAELPTAHVQARDKWRDVQPVDGCGSEASSRRPDVISFAHSEFADYINAVERGDGPGGWPIAHGRLLSKHEQMAQRAMFALKVLDDDGGLPKVAFEQEFGQTVAETFGDVPVQLCELGVLADDGDRLRLTELGTLFGDEVCQQFYTDELRRQMLARVRVQAAGAAIAVPRGAGRTATGSAAVVVVGAGIVGLATAVALAKDLGSGVVLCETEALAGQGATAASLGGFRTQFDNPVLAELSTRSLAQFERWATQTDGELVGLRRSGYLFLAVDDADVAQYQAQAAVALQHGEIIERISPQQVAELVQGIFVDDLIAGYWGPRDGQLDPAGLVRLLERQFLSLGGRFLRAQKVKQLRVHKGSASGVDTDNGWISAPNVVLAAGSEVGALLRAAGVTIPLDVARRRMVMASGPGLPTAGGPLVLSRQPPLYFRSESGGLLMSARELSNDVAGDWLAVVAQRASARIPALRHAGFREAWSGLQTHSQDGLPLVGPCPGLDGVWLAAALGGTGVMHAPAVGALVADWLGGRLGPDAARDALDPRRGFCA